MTKKNLILTRVYSDNKATLGVLNFGGMPPFAVVLELPWNNNQRDISCVPVGRYECGRVDSPKFGETFEILNVPDRSHILFHKGNLTADTRGCVLVAESFADLGGSAGVGNSRRGFNEFMGHLEAVDKFDFEIINVTRKNVYKKQKKQKIGDRYV